MRGLHIYLMDRHERTKSSKQLVTNFVWLNINIWIFLFFRRHCLVFRFSKDLYLIMTQKLTFMKSSGFHMKSGRFQVKSSRFHVKSTQNLIKSDVSTKTLQFGGVQGGGYDPRFHEIQGHSPSPAFIKLNSFGWNICFYKVLGGFHEIRRISCEIERPLARNCNPMFWILVFMTASWVEPLTPGLPELLLRIFADCIQGLSFNACNFGFRSISCF